jgi:predicted ribosome quality control (RQC) complex YloA/Tae2 family protein
MSKENAEKRVLDIPKKPPMFCMLLRKYLENSKIYSVKQPDGERILEFYIEIYNEVGEKIFLCLAFEFMGKHSNVILYNSDTDIILGCAHNVGEEKSRQREIYGGIPYVYPPKQSAKVKTWKSLVDEVAQY